MNDHDTMMRIFAKEAGLRGLACATTGLAREAAQRHRATPLPAAALANALTAAALLGALLKVQQRVALKIEADGPLRKLVAEADAYGRVRGYVAAPDLDWPWPLGPAALAEALGRQGLLTVVKDLGLRDLYQGAVALQDGDIEASLRYYFDKSEQAPTLVQLGVALDDDGALVAAGGLLFQPLPGTDPAVLRQVAGNLAGLPPLATYMAEGHTSEEIVAQAMDGIAYTVLEQQPLTFSCSCSRARSHQALKVLGEDDLLALIVEGEAVIDCHFCHERYIFDREELGEILNEIETETLEAMFEGDET
jgi:molecular chaperone Hsp33